MVEYNRLSSLVWHSFAHWPQISTQLFCTNVSFASANNDLETKALKAKMISRKTVNMAVSAATASVGNFRVFSSRGHGQSGTE